ncbi:MAG: hypothetical protein JXR88_12115 [Clostridia bacterium]|nr:hypothetical protein [Clostridia bacterium]
MSKEKNASSIGVLIILIGIVILLYNLDILKVTMFWGIVRLWPLLFIVIGLNIIFKKIRYMNVITWLAFFGIVIGYSYLNMDDMTWYFGDDIPVVTFEEAATEIEDGSITFDMSAGSISLESHNQTNVIYEIPESHMEKHSYDDATETLTLRSNHDNFGFFQSSRYNVYLPEHSTWYIDVDGGVLSVDLKLEDLIVTGGKIDYGVGDLSLSLPESTDGLITIDVGIGDVLIDVPDDLGVKIISKGGLVSFESDFKEVSDKVYESLNYKDAKHQVEIQMDVGIGSIEIK